MSQEGKFPIRLLEGKKDLSSLAKKLRTREDFGMAMERVRPIVREVERRGDEALVELTEEFDGIKIPARELRVSRKEVYESYALLGKEEIQALNFLRDQIKTVEEMRLDRLSYSFRRKGFTIRSVVRPIESVGCYVPGGRATYPSSLLMAAVPAEVAGVKRIVVVSPPSKGGKIGPPILVAADLAGVHEIYKVGGAQAVAALAFGTQTIKAVSKIVGPGNQYVTASKLLVSDRVDIDSPAGPTELLVIADDTADPRFIAKDMISQAEHGEETICGLVTNSKILAESVQGVLFGEVQGVKRGEVVKKALMEKGFLLVCEDLDDACGFVNLFAPEHLEVLTKKPEEVVDKIHSAGLILVGEDSPATVSDYCVGTNHILPTGGYSKRFSGLSVLEFLKVVNVVKSSRKGLERVYSHVEALSKMEGLPNHALAVKERLR